MIYCIDFFVKRNYYRKSIKHKTSIAIQKKFSAHERAISFYKHCITFLLERKRCTCFMIYKFNPDILPKWIYRPVSSFSEYGLPSFSKSLRYRLIFFTIKSFLVSSIWLGKWLMTLFWKEMKPNISYPINNTWIFKLCSRKLNTK